MGYYLCSHGGSADHRWEDRVRGTCKLLPQPPELVTACIEEDWRYGLAKTAILRDRLPTRWEGHDLFLTHRPSDVQRLGDRAVLWGWTADALPRHVYPLLRRFQRLVVPDEGTLRLLRGAGLPAQLGPDPDFLVDLPPAQVFYHDTVGLCLSAMGSQYEAADGLLFRSYVHLIRWLLRQTSFQILLIPYCVKPHRDDRLLQQALSRQFPDCPRLHLIPDSSSTVLRGVISGCRCVVGMGGAVAAWSCGVPALCLGANSRSMGLADALFGSWSDTVLPIATLRTAGDLTHHFRRTLRDEDRLRHRLTQTVPPRRHYSTQWDIHCLQ